MARAAFCPLAFDRSDDVFLTPFDGSFVIDRVNFSSRLLVATFEAEMRLGELLGGLFGEFGEVVGIKHSLQLSYQIGKFVNSKSKAVFATVGPFVVCANPHRVPLEKPCSVFLLVLIRIRLVVSSLKR